MEWNRLAMSPLFCKILLGLVSGAFLVVFVFHQPWIPVEITRPETGILVAKAAQSAEMDRKFSAESLAAKDDEPIPVPIAEPTPPASKRSPIQRVKRTAEVPPASPAKKRQPVPTYAEHIAPILDRHCVGCHRRAHPEMPLTDPRRVVAAATRIAEETQSHRMPPWLPKAGFGRFENARKLSSDELAVIQKWAKAGALLGHPTEPPSGKTTSKPQTWQLGSPTIAYRLPKPFPVPASDEGLQWNFVIPTGVERELYLTGVELRPGHAELVDRMVLSFDPTGDARTKDRKTPLPGFASKKPIGIPLDQKLGEWTPGRSVRPFPEDAAYRIPAGADLILTIDYKPSPESTEDPWSMGLHLSRKPPIHGLGRIQVTVPAASESRTSPAAGGGNSANTRQTTRYSLPTDVTFYSVRPQIPEDGIGLRVFAQTPDRRTIPLLQIEHWQSAWEDSYIFSEPIRLPKATVLIAETWFANPESRLNEMPAADLVFEVSTPNAADLDPLLRRNQAANLPR